MKPKILCVDDEPAILEGMSLHLARRFTLVTAYRGADALELLKADPSIVLIISDMRMPGMDGATLLAKARVVAPHATRLLLTGQAEMSAAIAAVNEGQIFRFLTKPCAPGTLLAAVEAGIEQNRLITAEKVLLEETLHGSIKALVDVLALTHPAAFGKATRVKQEVALLAAGLGLQQTWQLEVAAMLSQLGAMTLPAETAEKVYYGKPLSPPEQVMFDRTHVVTEQLLANIPRLEVVRAMLTGVWKPRRFVSGSPEEVLIETGAALLHVAFDFDVLQSQGCTVATAVDVMRGRANIYRADVFKVFETIHRVVDGHDEVREVSMSSVRTGMVFVDDVKMLNGTLLVARGYEVTTGFIERVQNFKPGTIKEPVRVYMSKHPKPSA